MNFSAPVTVQDFISDCESISCTAVVELPMEINNPSTTAMQAKYLVDTLGFQPAFFAYGNEPSGWLCYGISWAALAGGQPCDTSPPTQSVFANDTEAAIKAVTAALGPNTPPAICLNAGTGSGWQNDTSWLSALEANAYDNANCAGYALHVKPAHSETADPTLANFYASLTGPQALPADYQNMSALTDGKPLYMTEVGWTTPHSIYEPVFVGTWAVNVLQSALVVQAMQNQIPVMGWWAWNEGASLNEYANSTFGAIYTTLFPQLGPTWYPTQYSGQDGIFAEATQDGNAWSLLLVSTNINDSYNVSLEGSGFPDSGSATIYTVTASGMATSSLADLADGFTVPAQSVILVTTGHQTTPGQYDVTFTESGLPSGASWSVTFNGTPESSGTSSIDVTGVLNGTYGFSVANVTGYAVSPSNGSVTVDGSSVTEPVTFTAITTSQYNATFTETGLPSGAEWWVNVTGQSPQSSTAGSITIYVVNGSYSYTVSTVDKTYEALGGSFTVNGTSVTEPVAFSRVTYSVKFPETGLPTGTEWWVNVTGQSPQSSTAGSMTIYVVNGSYSYTVSTADKTYEASGGSFTVNGVGATKPVVFSQVTYTVKFTETGLPSGTEWWVNVTGQSPQNSTTGSITISLANGSYSYVISAVDKTYEASGGSFTVNGAGVTEKVAFSRVTYSVEFTENGLPSGASWSVTFNGTPESSLTSSIVITDVINGTFGFSVANVTGYTVSPSNGWVTVDGAGVTETVTFSAVTYPVTFTETGLPSGTEWWVSVTGQALHVSTGSAIALSLPNGTYSYVVSTTDNSYSAAGEMFSVNGAPVAQSVTFSLVTNAVTLTESGLPTGTEWWVNGTVAGSHSSTESTVSFNEPNGSYAYSVATTDKEYAAVGGSFTVAGAPVPLSVTFALVTYSLTFKETGLPTGTNWSVVVDGVSYYSTGTTIVMNEPNATYAFTVGAVSGYTVSRSAGNATVDGARVTEALTFTSRSTTIPAWEEYAVVAGVAVVVVGSLAVWLARRRRKSTTGLAPDSSSPDGPPGNV